MMFLFTLPDSNWKAGHSASRKGTKHLPPWAWLTGFAAALCFNNTLGKAQRANQEQKEAEMREPFHFTSGSPNLVKSFPHKKTWFLSDYLFMECWCHVLYNCLYIYDFAPLKTVSHPLKEDACTKPLFCKENFTLVKPGASQGKQI